MRKIIKHHIEGGTRESYPRVQDLLHLRLGKPRRGLQILDTRMVFPPSLNVVLDSINLTLVDLSILQQFGVQMLNSWKDCRPGLWLAETFTTSPLNQLIGPIGKTKWPPRPLIGWHIFEWTWQKTRSQRSLPSLCFSGPSENSGLWLAEKFSISPLKPLNRIQRNLI